MMPRAVSPTIILCVVAYLVICLLIGIWAMRRTRNSADFFLAAKALGPVVVILATISSVMRSMAPIPAPTLEPFSS